MIIQHGNLRRRLSRARRAIGAISALAALAAFGAFGARPALAQQLRYAGTLPGAILATGNTLGLSKQSGANGPGTADSIGTFTSLSNSVDDLPLNPLNPWPPGTTYDWTQNGSAAVLSLPAEAKILYAELLWGGSFEYVENVTAHLDDAITFGNGGATLSVAPDPTTKLTVSLTAMGGFAVRYYARSADVTAFVKAHGAGTYEVRGVPATQHESINTLSAAGWTLVVAYRDGTQPIRNLSVFVGGSFVDENSQQDYTVSGFCAPPSGPIGGRVAISAIEGDANRVGDQMLIAPSISGPFVNLSGPNNPQNNFFCSQLNDQGGMLDTKGTFGNQNQDAINGVDVSGGRQGWDVTTIPVSSMSGHLVAGQTSAVLRTITTGDSYVPTLAAFEIDVNAPNFAAGNSTLKTSASTVTIGDTLTATIDLDNKGQAAATNVKLRLPLEAGLSLVSVTSDGASGDVNGNAVDGAALAAGINEGTLAPGQHRTVVVTLDVKGAPAGGSFELQPSWSYDFVTCQGQAPLSEAYGQIAVVSFTAPQGTGGGATTSGSTSGAGGQGGGNAGGGNAGGGNAGGGNAGGGSSGGNVVTASACGCAMPGEGALDARWIGLGAIALLAARRRRRA